MPALTKSSFSFIASLAMFLVPGVHMPPGTRTFILKPCLPYSLANVREKIIIPAFVMSRALVARFKVLAVMDPEMHSSQDARAIRDLFDGEINIQEKAAEKGSERYLRIKRMSNKKYLENELVLKKDQ
jgi:hypothetical protein